MIDLDKIDQITQSADAAQEAFFNASAVSPIVDAVLNLVRDGRIPLEHGLHATVAEWLERQGFGNDPVVSD